MESNTNKMSGWERQEKGARGFQTIKLLTELCRQEENDSAAGEEVDFSLLAYSEPPDVTRVFYRDRADGPIHATDFCVTENGKTVKKVKPKHLRGVPQRQLRGAHLAGHCILMQRYRVW